MTKRQLIRAGFILAGALILNGCGRPVTDHAAVTKRDASQTTKVLAREGSKLLSLPPANR